MRLLFSFVVAVAFVPLAARADSTFTVNFVDTSLANVGMAACKANTAVAFKWDAGAASTSATESVFLSAKSDCSSDTGNVSLRADGPEPTQPETFPGTTDQTLKIQDFPGIGPSCGSPDGKSGTSYFCVVVTVPAGPLGGTASTAKGIAALNFTTIPPPAPTNVTVESGDTSLVVNWTWKAAASSKQVAQSFLVHTIAAGTDGGGAPAEKKVDTSACNGAACSTRVTGLLNGANYEVTVAAIDTVGDQSAFSAAVIGTPQQVQDFWRHYRDDDGGGAQGGGCASGGGAWWLALLAIPLWRRRKATILGALFLLPIAARAEPSRSVGFEFSVGNYNPLIDNELKSAGKTPYSDVFGNRIPLLGEGALSWEPISNYGTLAVGLGGGYWQNIGHGRIKCVTPDPASGLCPVSSDPTLLNILPFSLSLAYRFDPFVHVFPIAPFARVAAVAARWNATNGTGNVARDAQGHSASGVGYGYSWGVGGLLSLDWFEHLMTDGRLTREANEDTGLKATHFFAEYERLVLPANSHTLNLSAARWRFGLLLEY